MSRVEFNPLTPGATVHGRYVVEKTLGIGSMAIVYKCRDTRIRKRDVALKVLFPGMKEEVRARFIKEIMYTYEIVHPNVVRTYDLIEEPDFLAITMEYVGGGSLASIIYNEKPLSVPASLDILTQLTRGVHAIHEAGIVHRDLKPDNVLMSRDGQAKIADFSVAWANNATKLTRHGGVIGSFSYVSPEYMDNGQLDHRADIYALGVIGYELLTRQLPHKGDMVSQLVSRARNEVIPPRSHVRDCPEVLSDIVMKALEADPERRYQNVSEMYQDLERFKAESGFEGGSVTSEIADMIELSWPKSTGSLRPTVFVKPFYKRRYVHVISTLALGVIAAVGAPGFAQRHFDTSSTQTKTVPPMVETHKEPVSNEPVASGETEQLPERLSYAAVGSPAEQTLELHMPDRVAPSVLASAPRQVASPSAPIRVIAPQKPTEKLENVSQVQPGQAPPLPTTNALPVEPTPREEPVQVAALNTTRLEPETGVQFATVEYQVKAALLYKFLGSVSWSDGSPQSAASVKSICVVGEDPFQGAIEKILAGAKATEKVTVKRFPAGTSAGPVLTCNVAYINGEQHRNTNEVVEALQDAGVFTVTERLSAGMIHLFIHRGNVRFDVDNKVARGAGIQVANALIRLSADG